MQFKRFKLGVFLVIALMFLFLGTRVYEARAQAPALCPQVQLSNGWLNMDLLPATPDPGQLIFAPTFSEGLLGTFELLDNDALVGDLDWLYNDEGSSANNPEKCGSDTATTCVGSQTIGWWSQKNGRNTHVHFTNTAQAKDHAVAMGTANPPACSFPDAGNPGCAPLSLSVHVQILDENCLERLDFCDTYTPLDTHVYNLGDIITNTGVDISEAQIQGSEGTIIITPVVACDVDNRAIEFEFLYGSMRMIDFNNSPREYEYGVNMWVRPATNDGCECDVGDADGSGTFGNCGNPLEGFGGFADILGCSDAGDVDCSGPGGNITNCEHNPNIPDQLLQNFSQLVAPNVPPGPMSIAARSDVVVMNFLDSYNFFQPLLGYIQFPALSFYFPSLFDTEEISTSCPLQFVCFSRFGIEGADDPFPSSDEPLPSPTPTPTPTPSITISPTPTPTPTGGGGTSSSCLTLVGPVQAGSAMANVLIPLIPVAFAFGVRAIRRRKK